MKSGILSSGMNNQIIVNASIILLSCIISACFTFWALRKNNKNAAVTIEKRELSIREEIQDLLDSTFAEYKPLISRSMTLAANAGAQVKKTQAFERKLIETIQDDLPITPEMVRTFSPALGDMVDENPRLLVTAANIIQKVLGDGSLINISGSSRQPIDRRPEV